MKSSEYWVNRAERIIHENEKTAEQILKALQSNYETALDDIRKEIEAFYGRYASEQGLAYDEVVKMLSKSELKSFKEQAKSYYDAVSESEYEFDPAYKAKLHRLLSAKAYISRLQALIANIEWYIEQIYAMQQTQLSNGLETSYSESYYQAVYNIQKGTGIGFDFAKPNAAAISKAVKENWLGSNYSERIWENKDKLIAVLEREIPRGFVLGQNPKKIAKRIESALSTDYSNAIRLARTEFIHIANQATLDAYKVTGVKEYEITVTLDERTCPICGEMDKLKFEVGKEKVGVNYPVFHPNCRCTTIPYFAPDEIDAMFDVGERLAKGGDKKYYNVPADMTFSEWKKAFPQKRIITPMAVDRIRTKAYNKNKGQPVEAAEMQLPGNGTPKGMPIPPKNKKGSKFEDRVKSNVESGIQPLGVEQGQQNKHIVGTHEFNQHKKKLTDAGQYGPSELYGGMAEAQKLVDEFSGKGTWRKNKSGNYIPEEIIINNDLPIGIVVNNITGARAETTVFKIKYSVKGTHVVPDYPSKKRGDKQ